MITHMSKSLSSVFILRGIAFAEDREVCKYNFKIILMKVICRFMKKILFLIRYFPKSNPRLTNEA